MKILFSSLLLISFISLNTSAQFNNIVTPDERLVYYGEATSYMVKYTGRCAENALKFYKGLYNYQPSEKVTIMMHDLNDYGNAGASTIPRDFVMIGIAPSNFVYETAPANERINTTMNHEFAHIATLDEANSTDNFFRSIFFGKVTEASENPVTMLYSYLTTPRRASPRWYREGIAVYLETWMAGGIGRAMGGYDEMVFRTIVKENGNIYDMLGLESEGTQSDFQVDVNAYLYGTRFMSYLALKYGSESLIKWSARMQESSAFFASQFQRVYGIGLSDAWANWIEFEKNFQHLNIATINKYPITNQRSITQNIIGSLSRAYYEPADNQIYAAVNYPGQTAYIASIDVNTGKVQRITDIKGPALYFVSSLAYDPADKKLFFTTDNNDWRDLLEFDINSGNSRLLLKDIRTGELVFNQTDKSIWGIRHFNGISTIVRIPYPYTEWNQVYSLPYGETMYDIDVSHNGKLLTGALAEVNGNQLLIKFNVDSLMNGAVNFDTIYNFESSLPANFTFSDDDKYLYGSSYYSGVSNIYKYKFSDKDMSVLSNCETGLFRPIPLSKDSLIAFVYTSKGFSPVIIPDKPVENLAAIKFLGQEIVDADPIVKTWIAPPPSSINIDSLITDSGEYNAFAHIGIASIYPIVEGYKDFISYGLRFNMSDPVGFQNFNLTASYSPNNLLPPEERYHLGFEYSHFGLEGTATLNNAAFYDLFGPTKNSRKGYSFGLKYHDNIIYDNPVLMEYNLFANYYGNLERLPDYQNVTASYDKFLNAGVNLHYQDLRASLGAVDYEKGYKWGIYSNNNYVIKTLYPHIYGNFDYGIALPINHSSVWLRTSAGYSYGDRFEPFANFYFGGFGNNWVDNLHEKRYREYYSFPGVELNEISGTNYGKGMLEWNLPPLRFSSLGISS
ncbi:MAG: YncE family protein, partial [Methanococcaceae archaeon]